MKFCGEHWTKLRAEIIGLGMESLIAKSGEEAASRTMQELEHGATKTTFDPLMGAHNAIVSHALDLVGIDLMFPNEDGSDRCPLCFVQATHDAHCKQEGCKVSFDTWIGHASKDMLQEAKRLGLVGGA